MDTNKLKSLYEIYLAEFVNVRRRVVDCQYIVEDDGSQPLAEGTEHYALALGLHHASTCGNAPLTRREFDCIMRDGGFSEDNAEGDPASGD